MIKRWFIELLAEVGVKLPEKKKKIIDIETLPDGRNAHLIQQPYTWWQPKIKQRFDMVREVAMDNGYIVFVKHK